MKKIILIVLFILMVSTVYCEENKLSLKQKELQSENATRWKGGIDKLIEEYYCWLVLSDIRFHKEHWDKRRYPQIWIEETIDRVGMTSVKIERIGVTKIRVIFLIKPDEKGMGFQQMFPDAPMKLFTYSYWNETKK